MLSNLEGKITTEETVTNNGKVQSLCITAG